jgi:chromosome segregation ATPase
MTDPAVLQDAIARDSNDLDRLSKALYDATKLLDDAEERWDEVYDAAMRALEEEYAEAGRKSVPDHSVISAARRSNPVAYRNYRRAKHAVERLQHQLRAKTAALSGRQSNLNALRDEIKALGGPQPAGTTPIGARRAA